jgi:arginase
VENHWLVTPYALDAPLPALARLARPGWTVSAGVPSMADAMSAGSASDAGAGDLAGDANNAGSPAGDGQLTRMAAIHGPLVADVAKVAAEGRRPICVVGDCCQPIAVLAGLQRAGLAPMVVWFDAHGDFNTHETTMSGYVAGMSIAMITGRGNQTLVEAAGLKPLPDTDIILADARDLDVKERELLEQSKVARLTDVNEVVERVAASDRPFYVHFDVDVIDCAEAPAQQFPVAGGPSIETLRNAAARLHQTGRLVSASMNPWALDKEDPDGRTAAACWSIFNALVGGA